jgi:hypothetical protein
MHRRKSFYLLLYSFYMPLSKTYADVINEQISKNPIINNPSFCYILSDSALNITFLINFPLEVSNPVVNTIPIHPFIGIFGIFFPLLSVICLISSSCP